MNINTKKVINMPFYSLYSKDLNHSIEAKDKKEAIKKAKEFAEQHNIKAYKE